MIDADDDSLISSDSSPSSDVRHGVRQLAGDVVTLAELQTNLLQVEMRQWFSLFAAPTLLLAVMACIIVVPSLTVLLSAMAYFLAEAAQLSMAAATLISGGLGLLIAAVCALLAWRRARRCDSAFARSRVELASNIRWLKKVLSHPAEVADDLSTDPGRVWPR
jgi:hypothetical protein